MIHLSTPIIIELILGLFLWWVAIHLFTQNPFSRLIQIVFGIFAAISFYLTNDLFFYTANYTHQYYLNGTFLKTFIWTLYLPAPLLYHASLLLTPQNERRKWQEIVLYVNYLATGVLVFIEAATNLTRNYSLIYSSNFSGNLADATGKYFWLLGIFFILIFLTTAINFYLLFKKQKKFSENWYKYFWPFLGMLSALILGPIVLLSYYKLIPHSNFLGSLVIILLVLPLVYSIIKYNLFIEEARIILGKNFLYSTLGIFLVLSLFIILLIFSKIQFNTVGSLVFPYTLVLLIIVTHPAYNWLTTFIRDIIYNISSGLSIVNDDEIYQVLKNYNKQERLEDNPILRLNLISQKMRKHEADTPVDALRRVIQEAIEYFKPEQDERRRTKQNLKYNLLKMFVFDQAEEGQILWELGFEEYPLRIMARETDTRPPFFKSQSPSDYTYTSRNAFMALKREAIHDIAWRISYLEKLSKKKIL